MLVAALALAAALGADAAPPSPCPAELFRIGRSKNANVIVYEANLAGPRTLDARDPVKASWILLADKGQREGLNWLERLLAYGFDVRPATPLAGFWLVLKVKKERPLHLLERNGCPAAVVAIGGREGVLKKIYVKADDRALIPHVEYVDLLGVAADGTELHERIIPKEEEQRADPDVERIWTQ